MDSLQNDLSLNPSKFWWFVKSKQKSQGFPNTMNKGNVFARNVKDKCELFADFFQGVYAEDVDYSNQSFGINKKVDLGSLTLGRDDIHKALININTSKGDGPENISPIAVLI